MCLVAYSYAFKKLRKLADTSTEQPTDPRCIGCYGYRPGRTPDRGAFCLVFGGFRYSFYRQIRAVSGVLDTVLGGRPTEERSVWCLVVFGIRSVDRCALHWVLRVPSWADARQRSVLSGVWRFSVFVLPTDPRCIGCYGYRPGRTPDRGAFCLVFGGFRYSFYRQIRAVSGVTGTVLGGRPT